MAELGAFRNDPPQSSGQTTVRSPSQATPQKVRTVQSVDIPLPVRTVSMPAPNQMPKQEPSKAPNTSFSSFSTLTSMSGMSSQSSSRRIVKNGIPAVTNSDSASMSSANSDEELADFDSFAPRKKRKLTPPGPDTDSGSKVSTSSKPTRASSRLEKEKIKQRARESWRPLSPPPATSYKHSLLRIAKQSAREAASDEKIAELEAYVEEAEKSRELKENTALEEAETKNVAAALAEDSDEQERMLMAMDRTEALRGEESFYFFREGGQAPIDIDPPAEELDEYGLGFMGDETKRSLACSSGFLATVASQKGLPTCMTSWLQHRIPLEPSEELCQSYVTVLSALVQSQQLSEEPALSLSEIFEGQTIRDCEDLRISAANASVPHNLQHVLRLIAVLAPRVSPVNKACAFAELILLSNDDKVRRNVDLRLDVEQAMLSILDSSEETDLQTIFRETIRQILDPSLISRYPVSRAIAALPATSYRLHELRRRLALHILLEAPLDETLDLTSPSTGVRLLARLKRHQSFAISESTDYNNLHCLTDLLDIAIDAGFSDFAFLHESQTAQPKQQSTSLFNAKPAPQAPKEAAFNAQIDALTAQLRFMSSKIRDAGTSHLKRTEAKSALERLVLRLENAVRTRLRPRKGVFDRPGMGAGAMEGFVKRAGAGSVTIDESRSAESEETADLGEREEESGPERAALKSPEHHRRPGKQHKVTWKDNVVDDAEAGAADENAHIHT